MAAYIVSASMVRRVRTMLSQGCTHKAIARAFRVSPATISNIATGKRDNVPGMRKLPGGTAHCDKCSGVYPVPCPRCESLARRTAEIHQVLKWDNVEPCSAEDLPVGFKHLATEGGAL